TKFSHVQLQVLTVSMWTYKTKGTSMNYGLSIFSISVCVNGEIWITYLAYANCQRYDYAQKYQTASSHPSMAKHINSRPSPKRRTSHRELKPILYHSTLSPA